MKRLFFALVYGAVAIIWSGALEAKTPSGAFCYRQGERQRLGRGGPRNRQKALVWYRKGCKRRHGASCWRAAQVLGELSRLQQLQQSRSPSSTPPRSRRATPRRVLPRPLRSSGKRPPPGRRRALPPAGARRVPLRRTSPTRAATIPSGEELLRQQILLYRRSCRFRFGDGCAELGQLYAQGKVAQIASLRTKKGPQRRGGMLGFLRRAPNDLSRAHKLYRRACRYRSGAGCYLLWQQLAKKRPSSARARRRIQRQKKKLRRSIPRFLQKGCRASRAADCYLLGHLHFQGELGPKNRKAARKLFLRSCKLFQAEGCDYLGLIYGMGLGVPRQMKRSRRWHKRACLLLSAEGCLHLAGLVFRGLGGPPNHAKARALFARSCRWNNGQACLLLGEMLLRGEGGDRKLKVGLQRYKKACRLGQKEACRRVQAIQRALGRQAPPR